MKLSGRTILLTGGSAGIGLAFALKFLELGNEVIVTGRRQAVLDLVRAQLDTNSYPPGGGKAILLINGDAGDDIH